MLNPNVKEFVSKSHRNDLNHEKETSNKESSDSKGNNFWLLVRYLKWKSNNNSSFPGTETPFSSHSNIKKNVNPCMHVKFYIKFLLNLASNLPKIFQNFSK